MVSTSSASKGQIMTPSKGTPALPKVYEFATDT